MRYITDHKLNGLNDVLVVAATDEPGSGGANHAYVIYADETACKTSATVHATIIFQNGPIKEAGVNGLSNESLLAVVIDRLRSFQAGPFASEDNANALAHLHAALAALQNRTRERMARGVEGTLVK